MIQIVVLVICIIIIINEGVQGTWTKTSLPLGNYRSISASVSGTNISVVRQNMSTYSYNVYLSSDSGITWLTSSTPNLDAVCACQSSSTGKYIYLGSYVIYVSSNYGKSFSITSAPNGNYVACSTSATGEFVVAVSSNFVEGIIVSSSYGKSWNSTTGPPSSALWSSVAMSSSGQYIVAVQTTYAAYVSTSWGVSWAATSLNGYGYATISSTGQYFYLSNGVITVSSNYGYNWNVITENTYTFSVVQLVTSSNGQNLVAVVQTTQTDGKLNQNLWVSYNFAANWTMLDAPAVNYPYNYWTSLAMDSTGAYIFASQYNGTVYTFDQILPPTNSPTPSPTYVPGSPTPTPSVSPTLVPTKSPSVSPTPMPTLVPSWVKSNSPEGQWVSITSSGQYMAAVNGFSSQTFTSSNYGLNWNLTSLTPNLNWPLLLGQNGSIQVSFGSSQVSSGSSIYVSSNYGQTFKLSGTASNCCNGVALSSNSSYIIYGGSAMNMTTFTYPLYISSNYGQTFTVTYGLILNVQADILASASGQVILVYSVFSFYVSTNYGKSFAYVSNYPTNCNSMVCDSSCTLILCVTYSNIYKSTNTGMSFTQISAPNAQWLGATVSSSGQYAAAIQSINNIYSIYVSFDYGNTWSQTTAPTESNQKMWTSIQISSSGQYLAAGQLNGYIYTDVQTLQPTFQPTPLPNLMPSGYQPTTVQPTPLPNSPTLTVNVQVNNVISGTSYTQYLNAVIAYTDTITQTIVNSTNKELRNLGSTGYLSESNIFNLTVQPPSSSAASRRVLTSLLSIQVTYNIQSSMASLSADNINNAIANTLTSGTYNSALHYYAQVNDAPGLQNSTLTQTSVVNLATVPTQQSSGGKKRTNVGAIIGGILGSLILLTIVAAAYLHKKKQKSVNMIVHTTNNTESLPAVLSHRISIMSPNTSSTNTSTAFNPMINSKI